MRKVRNTARSLKKRTSAKAVTIFPKLLTATRSLKRTSAKAATIFPKFLTATRSLKRTSAKAIWNTILVPSMKVQSFMPKMKTTRTTNIGNYYDNYSHKLSLLISNNLSKKIFKYVFSFLDVNLNSRCYIEVFIVFPFND
jgi:hypothetical protein